MSVLRWQRRRRALRVFGSLLVLWSLLVTAMAMASPTPAAGSTDSLGGYNLVGRATAIRTLYDTPGSLPVGPLVEVTAPEAQASLTTGPFGSALSSTLYPGPLVEGGPALLATQGLPTEDVPPYPIVVRASTSGPPEAAEEPSPGTRMYARVNGELAEAQSTAGPADADPVLAVGGSRSVAASSVDGLLAAATATAEVNDIVALGGLLRIESVTSDLASSSDATTGRSSGRTVVTGATFAGVAVSIDEDGISFAPQEDSGNVFDPLFGAAPALPDPNEVLGDLGISVRVAQPEERPDGAGVTRVSEGLVIAFDREIGDTALDDPVADLPIPPIPGSPISGPGDLVTILTNRQVSEISIGRASVTASAAPGFEQPTFSVPSPAPAPIASDVSGTPATPGRPSGAGIVGDAPAVPAETQSVATTTATSPLGALGPTMFIGLLFGAVLGSVLLTAGTRKLPDWALDGATSTDQGCTAPKPDREDTPP